jgi:O-antigen/teichoic acid export membrane protein
MSDDTPLAYRAAQGGLWVTASSGWQLLFGFIANIILTRLLIPSAFGEFALAMFFAQLMTIHQKIGFGRAFVQFRDTSGSAIGTFFVVEGLAVFTGIIFMVMLTYLLPIFGYSSGMINVCMVLFVSLAIEGVGGIGFVLLEKGMFLKDVSILRSITFPLSYIPAFWGALQGAGVWSIVLQNMTNSILLFIGSYLMAYWRLPHILRLKWKFDKSLAFKYLRFGVIVGATSTAGMLFMKLDNFFVGTFVGITMLGFYDRAYNTAQWPGTFCSLVISRSVFFVYSRLQDDVDRLKKTASMVTWLVTTFSFPLGLMMFIIAPDLIALLYGEAWLPSSQFLRILIIYTTLRPLHENAGTLLMAIGKPQLTTRFNVIQLVILTILGFPFTLIWGAIGTSLAVVLAFIPGLIMAYYDVAKVISYKPLSSIVPPILVCSIIVAGYALLNQLTPLSQVTLLLRFITKSVYALTSFFFLLYVFQPRVTRERFFYLFTLMRKSTTIT